MKLFKPLVSLLFFAACAAGAAAQTTDSLENLMRANAAPLTFADGRLADRGADALAGALDNVQFVALGEEHNKRAMHRFGGALFRLLHEQYGFEHLALEEDALWGRMLSAEARRGGPAATLALALAFPNAFHLATEDEIEMIGAIGRLSRAKHPIWGLNQVFGAAHVYARLVRIAPDRAARDAARELLDAALEYEKERFQKNAQYLARVAKPEDFARLRERFRPRPGSEADFLIAQLALSHEIFAPYVAAPRPSTAVFYESGRARELNMKRLFADHYRAARKDGERLPKALLMFGQLHLYRGLSERTEQFTLGNFVSELAAFEDARSLHIYTAVDAEHVYKGPYAPLARVAADVAGKDEYAAAVIDLRPLFDAARTGKEMSPELRRLVMSHDFFLFLRDGRTGATERLKTPNFRWYPD